MSFFSNIWKGAKSIGQKAYNNVINPAATIGRKALHTFNQIGHKAVNLVKNPIVHEILDAASFVPGVGVVARGIEKGADIGEKVLKYTDKAEGLVDRGSTLVSDVRQGGLTNANGKKISQLIKDTHATGKDVRSAFRR
jgi:hypothetical protein